MAQLAQLLQLAGISRSRSGCLVAVRHYEALRGVATSSRDAGRQTRSAPNSLESGETSKERAGRGAVELLERFKDSFRPTPPVSFVRGMPAPTAMSWMRRRGPQVPHAALYRLFRQRQIRLFDGDRVIRVRASRPLRNGELLLFPAHLQPAGRSDPASQDRSVTSQHTSREREPAAAVPAAAPAATAAAGRRRDVGATGEGAAEAVWDWDGSGGGGGVGEELAGLRSRAASHAAAGPGPAGSSRGANIGGSGSGSGRAGRPSLFAASPQQQGIDGLGAAAEAGLGPAPPLALRPDRVRRWVLGIHPGLIFINKPAGVRVHGRAAGDADSGGAGGVPRAQTLEGVMQAALRFGEADEPRLVHRLDESASGVMVLARNADSAAWLSEAFRSKAAQALADGDGEEGEEEGRRGDESVRRGGGPGGLYVHRTYWAFLAGELQPRQRGRIRYPVLVDGSYLPAVTSYRVRATRSGVSWVELRPLTGRRHQLRVHCAHQLGAPIIGDARYGYRGLDRPAPSPSSSSTTTPSGASGSASALPLRDRLPPEWWALLGEDPRVTRRRAERAAAAAPEAPPAPPILLHARELVVKRPGKSGVVGVAPLPRYIRQLMDALGWALPDDR